ncbi:MAG: GspH/FimT family pseudopilin [Desulfovibrionales bacterium]|nr:GspH/FimT family pseudopilin [Desulfovibrionales bacterium]
MPKRKHRMNLAGNHRGFTLTELMIVVALMAILAAIAVPSIIAQMPKYRLNGAARQVLGDLVAARMQAVSQNNELKVFFLDNHSYMILDDDDNDGTADTGEATQTKDIQTDYYDVTFNSNNDPIFQPNGTASNLATITLSNTSGSHSITISSAGRVRIN